MNTVKFGWSEKALVPAGRRVNLLGQFYERITDERRDELVVTALAVECGNESAIFCGCDLACLSTKLVKRVRELLEGEDIPREKIIISAIHTHTGPDYANHHDNVGSSLDVLAKLLPDAKYEALVASDDDGLFAGEEAFEYICRRIAEAALDAWNNRSEGKYASAFGRAAVGMCRRVCYDDGTAKMWGDADSPNFTELEGGNDSGIELMFIADAKENLTGVIANVACPSQVLEHRNFMSADYWADVKKLLREKFGENIYLLPLCSAAGDQCPRDMIRWVEPETPINDPNIIRDGVTPKIADPSTFDIAGCEKIARRIATEIFWAYEEKLPYVSSAEMKHSTVTLDMPIRRVTPAEYEAALGKINAFAKEIGNGVINFKDNARMHVYAGILARFEVQKTMDLMPIEVHVLRLGDVAFATNPYELFLDYGNQIRARSHAKQTFLIQLSNGSYGYLPTEKAERNGHYSAYVSSGMIGHEGGNLLVRKTLSEINSMFE